MPFPVPSEWRYSDEFEIEDVLKSVKHLGGRVVRTYVISIKNPDGANPVPAQVVRPGEFNEDASRALDKVLEVTSRVGIRVVVPLVDNWKWWGGIESYAKYRSKSPEAFGSDPEVISDFKKTVSYVLNRRNTYAGALHKDDKAILAWETRNELFDEYSWTKEIADYLKSIDHNHLVWDGHYIGRKEMHPEALDYPNIDIVSSHHYPGPNADAFIPDMKRYRSDIAEKKVYVIGEFGFVPNTKVEEGLDFVNHEGIPDAMIWSLRGHNRDGGFYWHSEPLGAGTYKAYHYPGFSNGEIYEEKALFTLTRKKAFEINGEVTPPLPAPHSPKVLPLMSVGAISWQGSVGASSYDVDRAPSLEGPWTIVGRDVEDTVTQYRPLFADESAEAGQRYFYSALAKGSGGISVPSAPAGPITAEARYLVDEFASFSKVTDHSQAASVSSDSRLYKEDAHRVKGEASGTLTYSLTSSLTAVRLFAFQENEATPFTFPVSADGTNFHEGAAKATAYPSAANLYGYKPLVEYEITPITAGNKYVRIVFKAPAQIGRIEIQPDSRR